MAPEKSAAVGRRPTGGTPLPKSNHTNPLAGLVAGGDPPDEVNVIVEIPRGSSVKYEIDRSSGVVFVDRFLYTSTHFPFNYGFIPQTIAEDGDPLDALVLTDQPVFPTSVIRARPIGALSIEDEKGKDVKIVLVPARDVDPSYASVNSVKQTAAYAKSLVKKSILPG